MFSDQGYTAEGGGKLYLRVVALAPALCLSFSLIGCNAGLHQHATALAAATAPVVDQASEAYRDAETAYELGADYDAIAQFDAAQPVYNPKTVHVLLSEKNIQDRLAVLAAFQVYVQDVVALTGGTDSPELDAASKAIGGNLSSIGNTLGPSIEQTLGITPATESTTLTTVTTTSGSTTTASTTSSSAPVPLVSSGVEKGLGTAVDALGQFLVYRAIQKDLPGKVEAMDPVVQEMCHDLASDVSTLQDLEHRTYDRIINQQTLFLRENKDKLDPGVRGQEIMKLPELARQQSAADRRLTALQAAITKLAMTHHAFAAAVQGNNPESLKEKIGDLETAGQSLSKFY